MSKFSDLAAAVRDDMANFDQQAEELMKEREDLRLLGEGQFARYRDHHREVRQGLDEMRQALNDMTGSNSKNSGGSDNSSEKSKGG